MTAIGIHQGQFSLALSTFTEKQKNGDNARLTISYRVTPVYVQKLALGVKGVRGS